MQVLQGREGRKDRAERRYDRGTTPAKLIHFSNEKVIYSTFN